MQVFRKDRAKASKPTHYILYKNKFFPFSENTFGDGKITPKEAKYGGLYVEF